MTNLRDLLLVLRDDAELRGDENGLMAIAVALRTPKRANPQLREYMKEYAKTGKIKAAILAGPRVSIFREFRAIPGFSPRFIRSLIGSKPGLADLRAGNIGAVPLTEMQKTGLKYARDLREKIPREEVARIAGRVKSICDGPGDKTKKCETFDIAGSYRRELPECGDVDIVITSTDCPRLLQEIQDKIAPVCVLSAGNERAILLVRESAGGIVRQLDIICVQPESRAAALTYFTGCKEFNIRMRGLAKRKGLTLNQTGLYRGKKLIPVSSEEELFEKLGMHWYEPRDRNI